MLRISILIGGVYYEQRAFLCLKELINQQEPLLYHYFFPLYIIINPILLHEEYLGYLQHRPLTLFLQTGHSIRSQIVNASCLFYFTLSVLCLSGLILSKWSQFSSP